MNNIFTSEENLGQFIWFRSLFCLVVFSYLILNPFYVYAPYGGNYNPIPLFETFSINQWSLDVNWAVYIILLLSLFLLGISFKPRMTTILSTVFFFLFMGNNLGSMKSATSNYVWHSHNLILYFLITFNFVPSNKFGFKDSFYAKGYKWELLIFKLIACSGYFGSGYIKLATSGMKWMDGYTLQAYFIQKHILTGNTFSLLFIDNLIFLKFISWLTIILEVVLCFGLLVKNLDYVILFIIGIFHLMILLTLEINFLYSHFLPILCIFLAKPASNFFNRNIR